MHPWNVAYSVAYLLSQKKVNTKVPIQVEAKAFFVGSGISRSKVALECGN